MTRTVTTWEEYTLPTELQTPGELPTPTSFGSEWAIVGEGAANPGFPALLFILGWLTISGGLTLAQWSEHFQLSFWNLMTLLFFVAGLGMLYSYLIQWRNHLRSRRFGSPILLVNQQRYRPGDSLRLSFQRDIKPNTEVGAGTLSARLVCVEVARRTVGTDTTYDHVLHYEKDLGQQPTFGGQHQLGALWHAVIPADAQPTRIGYDHWMVWELQVRQVLIGQLDETTSFLIPVTLS